jgi:hypothetical protein
MHNTKRVEHTIPRCTELLVPGWDEEAYKTVDLRRDSTLFFIQQKLENTDFLANRIRFFLTQVRHYHY